MNKIKQAYITLLSSKEYLDGVLVMALSLKKTNPKYPLVVAVTEDIYDDNFLLPLKKINCIIEKIETLKYGEIIQKKWNNSFVVNTASKIQIFRLKHYDKLVYLDADSLILKNIDDLFDFPDGSMLKPDYDYQGSSELFVFEPKNHREYYYYPPIMQEIEVLDGNLLGDLWFFVSSSIDHQIPELYFKQYSFDRDFSNAKAIHFCNPPKPWLDINNECYSHNNFIINIYKFYLKEIEKFK